MAIREHCDQQENVAPVLSPMGMGRTVEKPHLAHVHAQNEWKPQDHH